MKSRIVLCLVVGVFLACIGWFTVRWSAISVLDAETVAGLNVKWRTVLNTRFLPGASPRDMHFNYDIVSASELANAVKHFGDVESLSINHGDERTIIFLAEIGRQKSLTKLLIFDAPVNDKILQRFAFPKLQNLALVNCDITGVHWPLLPELQEVDLGGCPISDEGFKAILKSPKINYLIFEDASITPNGLLMSGVASHPSLIHLQFSNCIWPRVSIEEADGLPPKFEPVFMRVLGALAV